jgi:hypothetical protein
MHGALRMNAALKIPAAVAVAALIGCAAGCSSKPAPTAHYLTPACPTAIAALPAHPPVTAKQALADQHAVDRVRTKNTILLANLHIVGYVLSHLRRDIATGRNTSRVLVTYNADVSIVRIYCRARSSRDHERTGSLLRLDRAGRSRRSSAAVDSGRRGRTETAGFKRFLTVD